MFKVIFQVTGEDTFHSNGQTYVDVQAAEDAARRVFNDWFAATAWAVVNDFEPSHGMTKEEVEIKAIRKGGTF